MMDFAAKDFIKIGHRGASAYEPENTIRSFERAMDMGCDFVELDVRSSFDGHLVVMHDKTVDRTTDGWGDVAHKTLDHLKRLDAGGGERIPTLEEVMGLAKGRAGVAIELKEEGTEKGVVETVRAHGMVEDVIVISFHRGLISRVKAIEPKIKTGYLYLLQINPVGKALECSADLICPYHRLVSKGLIRRAFEAGVFIAPWTVDSPKRAESLRSMGVKGIATNRPDVI